MSILEDPREKARILLDQWKQSTVITKQRIGLAYTSFKNIMVLQGKKCLF